MLVHEAPQLRQVLLAVIMVVVQQAAKVAGLVILLQARLIWQYRRLLSSVIDRSNEATSCRRWSFGSRSATANNTQ